MCHLVARRYRRSMGKIMIRFPRRLLLAVAADFLALMGRIMMHLQRLLVIAVAAGFLALMGRTMMDLVHLLVVVVADFLALMVQFVIDFDQFVFQPVLGRQFATLVLAASTSA